MFSTSHVSSGGGTLRGGSTGWLMKTFPVTATGMGTDPAVETLDEKRKRLFLSESRWSKFEITLPVTVQNGTSRTIAAAKGNSLRNGSLLNVVLQISLALKTAWPDRKEPVPHTTSMVPDGGGGGAAMASAVAPGVSLAGGMPPGSIAARTFSVALVVVALWKYPALISLFDTCSDSRTPLKNPRLPWNAAFSSEDIR